MTLANITEIIIMLILIAGLIVCGLMIVSVGLLAIEMIKDGIRTLKNDKK